jgi:hypothetical protein
VRKKLKLTLLLIQYMSFSNAHADVVEIIGGLDFGRFSEGVNLTSGRLNGDLSTEWSANNGAFSSLSCFINDNALSKAIQRGCDVSLGWFRPLNERHAITGSIARHDYSSPVLSDWQYTDARLSWHIGRNYMLDLRASDSLLGQGFAAVTTSLHASRQITEKWHLNFEAGVTSLQRSAPVSTLGYGILGAEYALGRWATLIRLKLSDSAYTRFVKLDFEQTELSVSLRYRLY